MRLFTSFFIWGILKLWHSFLSKIILHKLYIFLQGTNQFSNMCSRPFSAPCVGLQQWPALPHCQSPISALAFHITVLEIHRNHSRWGLDHRAGILQVFHYSLLTQILPLSKMWPCIVLKWKILFSELCSMKQFFVFLNSTHHSQLAYDAPSA